MGAIRSVLLATLLTGVLIGLTAAPAFARMTITGPFGTGLTEPVWVIQHLLGFLAIGLWAGQNGGPAVWQLPVAALTAVLAAGLAAQLGIRLPYAAQGLAVSLILTGGLVALNLKAPLALAVLTAAVAAAFHGYMHMGGALFWAGLSAGILLVTCAGLGLAAVLGQAVSARAPAVCGGAVALVGVLDLAGVF
ncbi:HupE/UreJ family protein [Azospirillum rugosum]|uniref:HupE/UreJ family protein n=1 Tax=Azospirillum rugosum TaxID=416170 RepID=UPI001AE87A09